jgi:hypothetical protein
MLLDSRGASELPGTFRGTHASRHPVPRGTSPFRATSTCDHRIFSIRERFARQPWPTQPALLTTDLPRRAASSRSSPRRRRRLTGRDRDPCGHLPDSGSLRIPREIGWSFERYGEAVVQRAVSPGSLVPWLLFGTSVMLSVPMSYMYPGPLQEQNVPLIPMMITAAGTAVWNATDWNYRPIERSLRRYGRDGVESILRSRPRRQWELAVGLGATVGLTGFRIEPGPVAQSYGVETIEFAHATAGSPSLASRYWRSPSVAVGGEMQIGALAGSESLASLGRTLSSRSPGRRTGTMWNSSSTSCSW